MSKVDKFLRNVPTHGVDVSHRFIELVDTPATYSGSENSFFRTTASGVEFSEISHGDLTDLSADDHQQYTMVDGSRGFTGPVSGVAPTEDEHITTMGYVEDYVLSIFGGLPPTVSGEVNSLVNFDYAIDNSVSSHNSTSPVNKLRLTVSGTPDGFYRVAWAYLWRCSKSNEVFYAQIELDDTEQLFYYSASPFVDINYWNPISIFTYHYISGEGPHTIDLEFWSSASRSTVYIKDARMEFWRII